MNTAGKWRNERVTAVQEPAEQGSRRAVALLVRLLVAAMCITVLAAGLWGLGYLYRKLDVPIALIGVDGEISHLDSGDVEDVVAANLSGGFLSLDLKSISSALEEHPWVAAASARRQWPDRLVIVIHEEVPIARWGDSGVLNNRGQPLAVGDARGLDTLPLLAGPTGMEREVMQQYRMFTELLQSTGLHIVEFRMGARGGWHLRFAEGPTLAVGRGQVVEKIQRFLQVWDSALAVRLDQIDNIDIRYSNGVAVRWKTEDPETVSNTVTRSAERGTLTAKRTTNG